MAKYKIQKYVEPAARFKDPHGYLSPYRLEQLSRYPRNAHYEEVEADRKEWDERRKALRLAYAQRANQEYYRAATRLRQLAYGGLYGAQSENVRVRPIGSPAYKRFLTLAQMFNLK